jgi:hypothetical protein
VSKRAQNTLIFAAALGCATWASGLAAGLVGVLWMLSVGLFFYLLFSN